MEQYPIEINGLCHNYGKRELYNNLSINFEKGKIYALLGKNGVGKTTLIQILMGFMRPVSGQCRIFGDASHAIRPSTRQRIGLLFERHLAYDFCTIEQIERFTRKFYSRWRPELYYNLVEKLGLPMSHRIAHMSEGQRSQVVLGLILAQDPELLILDDYSMGLDAGYRRLFVDYLCEHLRDGKHTIVVTSHVIQDMENFVDEAIFMRRDKALHSTSLKQFMHDFTCYKVTYFHNQEHMQDLLQQCPDDFFVNLEWHKEYVEIFSYRHREEMEKILVERGVPQASIQEVVMDMEDAFIGFTGRY